MSTKKSKHPLTPAGREKLINTQIARHAKSAKCEGCHKHMRDCTCKDDTRPTLIIKKPRMWKPWLLTVTLVQKGNGQ